MQRRRSTIPTPQAHHPSASVEAFHHFLEGILGDLDDADFAHGVLRGVAGVRGVDHDVRAEFLADGSGRRLGGIGRPEDVANLVHRINAFIDERDALLGAGFAEARRLGLARGTRRR